MTYRAWDQTAGTAGTLFAFSDTGGAYAFSSDEAIASLTVNAVNHAPMWTVSAVQLPAVAPGAGAPSGGSISSLFGGSFADADGGTIPGLHAAGELVGGLFYFNYPGGTGLMAGSVFGRIAGTTAGRRAPSGASAVLSRF